MPIASSLRFFTGSSCGFGLEDGKQLHIDQHRSACSASNVLERDGSSAGLSSDAIHLQMGMTNVARGMTQISRQVWLRFGMLPRPFEAPRTKAMLSSRNSNRFPRLSVDRQAWRIPMTYALPSSRHLQTARTRQTWAVV